MTNYEYLRIQEEEIQDHLKDSLEHFSMSSIVSLNLHGSQNYGLETVNSDIDTILIVTPTLKQIATNYKPISTTYVRENNEHINFKDVRLFIQSLKKQNPSVVEVLFTKFKWTNDMYQVQWDRLIDNRELIARYCPYAAVRAAQGQAHQKYKDLEHRFPTKEDIIDRYGYDGKQLSHLLRIEDFLAKYIAGYPYEECLKVNRNKDFLIALKNQGVLSLEEARELAEKTVDTVDAMAARYFEKCDRKCNEYAAELMDDILYEIIKIAIRKELN